jgi:hypothetical protein
MPGDGLRKTLAAHALGRPQNKQKEPELSRHRWIRAAAAAITVLSALPSQAQQSYGLRAFNSAVDFPPGPPDSALIRSNDRFNDGNPLSGPAYTGLAASLSYTAVNAGFSPGSELAGAASDFFGTTYGVGQLRFSMADATPTPSNLDAAGTAGMSNRLVLNNPGSGSLLNLAQSFEVTTYWNFATPDAGTTYGIRLSDNPFSLATPGTPFNDLIDLRVVRGSGGVPAVQLRKLSYDGSTLSVAEGYTLSVAQGLFSGHTLAEVAIIGLELHYNAGVGSSSGGLPYLLSRFTLTDAQGVDVGDRSFTQQVTLFNGESFTTVSAGAAFTQAVPETGTGALMLAGALALARCTRRRTAA